MPTAIYTRPTSWGGEGARAPVALANLDGSAPEYRIPVGRDRVPEVLVQAVFAVEDQRFESHHGLDVRRIGGALLANLKAGRIHQGGSTITQQLVKNVLLSHRRTPLRKAREAALALAIEARHDKAEILEAYLNEIYLGYDGRRPIHGVGAAARYYFGKEVSRLGLAEAALLAGMIQAPNRTTPIRHERQARRRRNLVLTLMRDQGRIDERAFRQATRARVPTRPHPAATLDARYARDYLARRLPTKLPKRGMALYTTIDAGLQRAADRAVTEGLRRLGTDAQAALVAIDPRTGDLLAMVGGRDYAGSQFNRATDAKRQPGSAFKPIVALAALERAAGDRPAFTLASRIEDEPLTVRAGSTQWQPTNYDHTFRGVVTLREALEQSLNVPFVRVGLEVGAPRIVATARRLGIRSQLAAVPSLALGSSEVTLSELVRAYGVFAAGGRLAPERLVVGQGSIGQRLRIPEPPPGPQVVDPAAAFLVTSALEWVIQRGTGRALALETRFGAMAGKTGTSNEWRDAWFVAYAPSIVVGVWVGHDDGRSLRRSGADAALPIVARFLERTDPDDRSESFERPDGIETASPDCYSEEFFLAGTAPETSCDADGWLRWRWGDDDDDDDDEDGEDTRTGPRDRRWHQDRAADRSAQWQRRLERRAARAMERVLERLLERAEQR